jgi:hypothetical protein
MNFFDAVLQAVNTLVQQNLGIFDGMGQNLFRAFATILVVWYGIKAALAAGEQRGGFHFDNFVTLLRRCAEPRFWPRLPPRDHR